MSSDKTSGANAVKRLIAYYKHYSELVRLNREDIEKVNCTTLKVVSALMFVMSIVLMVFNFVDIQSWNFSWLYLLLITSTASFAVLSRLIKNNSLATTALYVEFLLLIAYSALTSAFIAPQFICVTILAFVCLLPILVIDKGYKLNITTILFGLGYIIFISFFKNKALFFDEAVNTCCFTIGGLVLGGYLRRTRIENFELKRQGLLREYTDSLTGIGNRIKLFEVLKKADAQKIELAVAMIDIDWFKEYNDSYGHVSGDECLRVLGTIMKEHEGRGDVRYFRYGGEEFVALCSLKDKDNFLFRLKELALRLSKCAVSYENSCYKTLTLSIGIAVSNGSICYEELLINADKAMYEAKASGRNTIREWEE